MKIKQFMSGAALAAVVAITGCTSVNKTALSTAAPAANGAIILKTAMTENENAYEAGKTAAEQLMARLNGKAPHAVLMVDCFDSKELKEEAIDGVSSVFDAEIIFGGAVYGMYTQDGAFDTDGVSLMALAGDGLQVQTALTENMGAATLSAETQKKELVSALNKGGADVASQLVNGKNSDLIILMGDAHSPKNQFLLDGLQSVVGKKVPVTGGSISKNDGLQYVYYRGEMYKDSAIAIALKGGFDVAQSGRQAKSNDKVISTAKEGSATAIKALGKKPFAVIAYDCAGRMGKVNNLDDELNAIKSNITASTPVFGCYCAGEFGPADTTIEKADSTPKGRGWHVMFSVLGK